jgi:hypothetical protein
MHCRFPTRSSNNCRRFFPTCPSTIAPLKSPNVALSHLPSPPENLFTSGRILHRSKAEPGGEVAPATDTSICSAKISIAKAVKVDRRQFRDEEMERCPLVSIARLRTYTFVDPCSATMPCSAR